MCVGPIARVWRGSSRRALSTPAPDGGPQWEQQIAHYCNMDLPDKAQEAYRDMVEAGRPCDTPTYNRLIATFAHRRRADRAQHFFDEMARSSHAQPDEDSYNLLLQAYGEARQPAEAQRLLAHMRSSALSPSIHAYNALLRAYVALGDLEGAEKLWAHMEQHGCRDSLPHHKNQMVMNGDHAHDHETPTAHHGHHPTSLSRGQEESHHEEEREEEGEGSHLVPNEQTYQAMLDLAAARQDAERAQQWLRRMQAQPGLEVSDEAMSTVLELLGRTGQYERARALFEELQAGQDDPPSCGAYTALMQAAVACEKVDEALGLYDAMKKAGVAPSSRTLDVLIHACGHTNRLHEAACLLGDLEAHHLTPTLRVERVKRRLHQSPTV